MMDALYARVSTLHQTQTQTIGQQLNRQRARLPERAGEQRRLEECL